MGSDGSKYLIPRTLSVVPELILSRQELGLIIGPGRGGPYAGRKVRHLVLVIPGINGHAGVDLHMAQIRHAYHTVARECFPELDTRLEVEFEAHIWQEQASDHQSEQSLQALMLDDLHGIREIVKAVCVDVVYYLNKDTWRILILSIVQGLNKMYRDYVARHSDCDVTVSVMGHSIGGMLAYDALEFIGDGPDERLAFKPWALWNFGGSTGPMLAACRGITPGSMKRVFTNSPCRYYFNIFHKHDPIAARFEPLVQSDLAHVDPVRGSAVTRTPISTNILTPNGQKTNGEMIKFYASSFETFLSNVLPVFSGK
eukprot:NODE_4210_length_1099_cov_106.617828_g4012_i0.p1 GENE.NODE_4210_length_1099_cov_106.617828_g4012_i0~~NODE_4210_length_1099_cov_106.617828_g4012_i0.p1  ORF type:complete len:313 (-),score=10.76 NODE_4210_length_1099_cov_106.617828_g4012_i0:49-987(-)